MNKAINWPRDIEDRVKQIRDLYKEIESLLQTAEETEVDATKKTRKLGRILAELQQDIKRIKQWTPRVNNNCPVSSKTAYRYIKLYEDFPTDDALLEEVKKKGGLAKIYADSIKKPRAKTGTTGNPSGKSVGNQGTRLEGRNEPVLPAPNGKEAPAPEGSASPKIDGTSPEEDPPTLASDLGQLEAVCEQLEKRTSEKWEAEDVNRLAKAIKCLREVSKTVAAPPTDQEPAKPGESLAACRTFAKSDRLLEAQTSLQEPTSPG
jgi:hypothetical protein